MGKGGRPPWYQTAVPEVLSTWRLVSLYQWRLFSRCQTVRGLARTCFSEGRRVPTKRGRPLAPFLRVGVGRNRRASRRRRGAPKKGRRPPAPPASRPGGGQAPPAPPPKKGVGEQ